jgi:hypothetical protein
MLIIPNFLLCISQCKGYDFKVSNQSNINNILDWTPTDIYMHSFIILVIHFHSYGLSRNIRTTTLLYPINYRNMLVN